jgi:aminopeptidase-like protein
MVKNLVAKIDKVLSGERAKDYVAEIIQHHRIQASPGFRAAAKYVAGQLTEYGVKNEILSFPGDGKTFYWASLNPQEWAATDATLDLIEPEKRELADFRKAKLSLIQRSAPVKDAIGEVILLEDGERREDYRNLNIKGKIVMTKGTIDRVCDLAVKEFGAIGIIYDGIWDLPKVRGRFDIPDALQYTSFWWRTGDKKCFGFVLSPKKGEAIRQLFKQGKKVKVKANVKSRFLNGKIEVVSALIPGRTDKEILLVGHLCHPQPSANDNASGSGALLEIARTLKHLIQTKQLEKPKCSIRLLWVPEMTGTYCYLATNPKRIKKTIAALNLDMVGQNQDLCKSSFLIENPPMAMPSYSVELLERIREELITEVRTHGLMGGYALFRYAVTPFSGGSDHYILSDPTVGIPCPMLIQWPDKFYHTSMDTLEKVDPKSLKMVGTISAAYAYFLANASNKEATWLAYELISRFKNEVIKSSQEMVSRVLEDSNNKVKLLTLTEKRMRLLLDQKINALASISWLGDIGRVGDDLKSEMKELIEKEISRIRRVVGPKKIASGKPAQKDKWEKIAEGMIPVRQYTGPVTLRGFTNKLSKADNDKLWGFRDRYKAQFNVLTPLAEYRADGKRNLLEIIDLVELETGIRASELIVEYFRILEKLKLVVFHKLL